MPAAVGFKAEEASNLNRFYQTEAENRGQDGEHGRA